MDSYEKLGAFYLGRRVDPASMAPSNELILYDSKDLTTHACIIGMTGSGKTGLGIGLIEEAAIDRIPVIAIDPKGDLGNLLLTFPRLAAADFEPWVDPQAALEAGADRSAFASATADLWRNGLAQWGQAPSRIEKLRSACDMAIYTPGSTAGLPLSLLGQFAAPSAELLADADAYRERLQSTTTGILTLLDMTADPLTSREHILIANVLDQSWRNGAGLDLAGLIAAIQAPGFARIGVMDLDTFYPPSERFELAMRINNLLAAPGFDAWMQGAPLDMDGLLYTPSGQPRVSIMSIAHLGDAERMFFVTMLLNELISWMRGQPGSGSLRAVLYMDEIFGYLPPVANPPSKKPFLTLLKQARAYGIGLVLATQNPVDLDYKALSNTGTWFIGRLQTERDKARVSEGLRTAAGSEAFSGASLGDMLTGLGKRRFLLHNVHEKEPVLFETRWVMSYLAGPLTRDQIRRLMAPMRSNLPAEPVKPDVSAPDTSAAAPILPPGVEQFYLPVNGRPGAGERLVYVPRVTAAARVLYTNARLNINEQRSLLLSVEPLGSTDGIDWNDAEELDIDPDVIDRTPLPEARFGECPAMLVRAKAYPAWQKDLRRWLRTERPLTLFKSGRLKETSQPGESERDFRIRLQQRGNELRDQRVAKLRVRYEAKVARLEDRLRRAEQVVEREAEQVRGYKVDTAISFGTALLGALLGRKRVSATSASRVGTAVRKAGRLGKQSGDVRRAEETVETVRAQLLELEQRFDVDVDALDDAYDAQAEELKDVTVRASATNIHVQFIGLGWAPHIEDADRRLRPA